MNNKKVYRSPWRSFPTTLNTYHSEGTLLYVSYYVNYISGGWISKDYCSTLWRSKFVLNEKKWQKMDGIAIPRHNVHVE